jgi:tRNA-Thr(GGU) m(6)t(6)A37 methyltransferase TsaA
MDETAEESLFGVRPIGRVESPLRRPEDAPKQGTEGGPEVWVVLEADVEAAARDLRVGDDVYLLTWLHRGRRDVLVVHPRDDPLQPQRGVFSTRSQDRPNPIGLHRVEVVAIEEKRILVRNLEAFDGTPVLDIKPVLAGGY